MLLTVQVMFNNSFGEDCRKDPGALREDLQPLKRNRLYSLFLVRRLLKDYLLGIRFKLNQNW